MTILTVNLPPYDNFLDKVFMIGYCLQKGKYNNKPVRDTDKNYICYDHLSCI